MHGDACQSWRAEGGLPPYPSSGQYPNKDRFRWLKSDDAAFRPRSSLLFRLLSARKRRRRILPKYAVTESLAVCKLKRFSNRTFLSQRHGELRYNSSGGNSDPSRHSRRMVQLLRKLSLKGRGAGPHRGGSISFPDL